MIRILSLLLAVMIHGCACTGVYAFTDGKRLEFNQASGVRYTENFAENTDFEINIVRGLSSFGGGNRAHSNTDIYFGRGKKYLKWTPTSQNQTLTFNIKSGALSNTLDNCAYTVMYRSEATSPHVDATAKIELLDNSSNVIAMQDLPTFTEEKAVQIPEMVVRCSQAARQARITWTGTVFASLGFDEQFYGQFRGWVGTIPEPQIFSVAVAANGTVGAEVGGDWINGNCTNATIPVCTFTSGWFGGTVPHCWAQLNTTGNSIAAAGNLTNSTSVAISMAASSNQTAASAPRIYYCQRTPSDPKYQGQTVVQAYGLVRPPNEFPVSIDGSGGVLSDPTKIVTSCTNANPSVCTLKTGHFTVTPICVPAAIHSSGRIGSITAVSTSSITIRRYADDGTNVSSAFNFVCFYGEADHNRWLESFQNVPQSKYLEIFGTSSGTCSSNPCPMLDIENAVLNRVGAGSYQINVPAGMCVSPISCGIPSTTCVMVSPSSTKTQFAFTTGNCSGVGQDAPISFVCRCKKF